MAELRSVTSADDAPLAGVTSRGRYKVFLGMAAGVGKTYRMLQEGQAEAEAGRDVVIGYLEPHGRAETLALADGLETIPRRQVEYRGTTLSDMDLPAILRRAPELCLIDELAHTNAPGSSTRSATRTSPTSWRPGSTSTRPSTSSTSRASTTRSPS